MPQAAPMAIPTQNTTGMAMPWWVWNMLADT